MAAAGFSGFFRPQDNFYRLPNDWFDTLADMRETAGRRRITSIIRLLEYIIKWSWGRLDFEGYIRLTFDELQHGKVIGRRGRQRIRADLGTGLPRSGLNAAIQDALTYGLLERLTDERDAARVRQAYRVRLREQEAPQAQGAGITSPFPGFQSPRSNYFIVPKIWTDLISDEGSDTLILAVEYFFRHCWGWRQADETHWLTAEEVAQGRIYRHSLAQGALRRYDRGIRYTVDATRRALDLGMERGWLVRKVGVAPSGWDAHLYTLRRFGWPTGEVVDEMMQGIKQGSDDDNEPNGDLYEPNTISPAPNEPTHDFFAPINDLSEPYNDASAPRTILPTLKQPTISGKQPSPPPTHPTAQPAEKKAVHGGRPSSQEPQAVMLVTLPHRRQVQRVVGRPWAKSDLLSEDEIILYATAESNESPPIVISLDTAAELLSGGLPAEQLGWADETPQAAEEKWRRLNRLVRDRERSQRLWGAPSLQAALERHGVARSIAAAWIGRWGETQVGGWLQALRNDPSVRSLPALLYTRLKAGDPPPT